MFRFGRSTEPPTSIRWPQLLPLLEDDDRRAAVQRDYPNEVRESYLVGLRRVAPSIEQDVLAAGRQLEAAEPLSHYPTIAVAGMLNSGKTSLVANFLSAQGRDRSLRGENNDSGTHRFVLWLPSRWREDAALWGLLMQRIGEALGQPPEMLDDSPERAHQQYNNISGGVDALSVPLVAVDPGLDEHGVGLLDCPDIVSDAAFGRGAPQQRRDLLRRAATLCSAFVVVTGAESIRDATLGDLLRIATELMPGVPRFLAVNKVRPRQTPDSVWANTRSLVTSHGVDGLYAAYDYDVPGSAPFIPSLEERAAPSDDEPLPTFFRVAEDPDDNPPAAIPEAELRARLLIRLPGSLDYTELFSQVRVALETRVREQLWNRGLQTLQDAAAEHQQRAEQIRQSLLEAALEFFGHREPGGRVRELRLHQSERIVRQLSQAFAEAAPWYARYGMRLRSWMVRVIGDAKDLVGGLAPGNLARGAADKFRREVTEGRQGSLLTDQRLADAISLRMNPQEIPAVAAGEALQQLGQEAIRRFESEDFTSLDPHRLRQAVDEVWRQMPAGKKLKAGLTPLAIIFALFAAVLMVPIDFGGTGVVLAASIQELLLAAGLSMAAAAWSGKQATVDMEQQAARQQLSNFMAVLCDALGIPRGSGDQPSLRLTVADQPIRLPEPNIPQRLVDQPTLIQWHVRDEFLRELRQFVSPES